VYNLSVTLKLLWRNFAHICISCKPALAKVTTPLYATVNFIWFEGMF